MIDAKILYKKAEGMVQAHGTRNPIEIAESMGIEVIPVDYYKTLLGMYCCQFRLRFIFLNDKMDEYLTQIVAAHELGHDTFHREQARKSGFKEFEIFHIQNKAE